MKWEAGNDDEVMMKDQNKEDDVDNGLESDLPDIDNIINGKSWKGIGQGGYAFRRW